MLRPNWGFPMQRRRLLGSAALAAGAGLLSSCRIRRVEEGAAVSGLPRLRWRMATSWPHSLDTIFGGVETICRRVGELSSGRFVIEPFAAGELVPGLEVLDAVQNGSVECGHTSSYYYIGKNPSLAFGTSVPFGLTAQQQNAWLYEGGGNDALNRIFADFGVISFPAGNTGAQMGGWFKRPLAGLSSLQGLKMRIPGLGGKVMAALGVNVQVLRVGRSSWPSIAVPSTPPSGAVPTTTRNSVWPGPRATTTTPAGGNRVPRCPPW